MAFQLTYHSLADKSLTDQEIQDILNVARAFNAQYQITGCLLFCERKREFLQILEGEEQIIEQLFDSIRVDKRHNHVYTISKELHTQATLSKLVDGLRFFRH